MIGKLARAGRYAPYCVPPHSHSQDPLCRQASVQRHSPPSCAVQPVPQVVKQRRLCCRLDLVGRTGSTGLPVGRKRGMATSRRRAILGAGWEVRHPEHAKTRHFAGLRGALLGRIMPP